MALAATGLTRGGVALEHGAAQRGGVPQRHLEAQAQALFPKLPRQLHLLLPAGGRRRRVSERAAAVQAPHPRPPARCSTLSNTGSLPVPALLALEGSHDDAAEAGHIPLLQLGPALQQRRRRRRSVGGITPHGLQACDNARNDSPHVCSPGRSTRGRRHPQCARPRSPRTSRSALLRRWQP